MIEEKATVLDTEGGFAWVETQRKSTCNACDVNKGCGTATLSKVIGQKRTRVRALNHAQARPGDSVVVGLHEEAMLRGSLLIYAMPLVLMFGAGLLGQMLASTLRVEDAEPITIVFSMLGLLAGFYAVKRFSDRISDDERYQAVVLRREEYPVQFIK